MVGKGKKKSPKSCARTVICGSHLSISNHTAEGTYYNAISHSIHLQMQPTFNQISPIQALELLAHPTLSPTQRALNRRGTWTQGREIRKSNGGETP